MAGVYPKTRFGRVLGEVLNQGGRFRQVGLDHRGATQSIEQSSGKL
jgi:hypothetical protein